MVVMYYGTHQPPGPATIESEANSIKWAVRELLFKQYRFSTTNIMNRTRIPEMDVNPGPLLVALDPTVFSVRDTIARYGPSDVPGYTDSVLRIRDEGRRGTRPSDFVWPILTNHKARH